MDGRETNLFVPNKGTMQCVLSASIASSLIIGGVSFSGDGSTIQGFPRLDGGGGDGDDASSNVYCPIRIWVSLKETKEFSCATAYNNLYTLLTTSDCIKRTKAFEDLCDTVWGDHDKGPYITLGIDVPDTGSGSARHASFSDAEFLTAFAFFR